MAYCGNFKLEMFDAQMSVSDAVRSKAAYSAIVSCGGALA